MLSVPVDYTKPDGDVAQLAMIRFKATGDKIGSLIINPGGPGESGVQAAASVRRHPAEVGAASASTWSASTPAGSARRRPRCGATPTPTTTGCGPTPRSTTRPRASRTSSPRPRTSSQRCVDKMGKDFLANVGTANVVKDLDAMRAALGDDKLTYLGYSYGTRIGSAYAEAYPQNVRAMILDGAVDPNADPIEADIRQAAAFQTAFNDYAADCAKEPSCPLGTDPAKAVEVYHEPGRPAGEQARPDRRSARAELQRRDRRHDPAAVLAEPVAPPHPGPYRAASAAMATPCSRSPTSTWAATTTATTTTPPTSGSRSTASTSRR